jgi:hypothetical protein
MENLAKETQSMKLDTDQVQDFTPTPLTVATTIFATGYHPYTMEQIFCEHDPEKKKKQKSFFFEKTVSTSHAQNKSSSSKGKSNYTHTRRGK